MRFAAITSLAVVFFSTSAFAQVDDGAARVHLALGAGVLASGTYFTGPGDLELASGTAATGAAQVSLTVHPRLEVVLAAAYARPEWELSGVPLAGTVGVSGASLWFADAAVRGRAALGSGARAPSAFVQIGSGVARYSLDTSVLGVAVDERATNFAVGIGAGLTVPLARRFGVELMVKDYIASFRSVRDLAAFGVEGRRAHTVVGLVSARLGL
jgi:hypothetical protein